MADEAMKPLTIQELTSRAGKARMVKMTPEERRRVAKLGAQARWAKHHPAPPPPDPPDPGDPRRDSQYSESGIMSTPPPVSERKPVVPVSVKNRPESFRAAA